MKIRKIFEFITKSDEERICKKCGKGTKYSGLYENYMICPHCDTYQRMSAKERLEMITDENTFKELDKDLKSTNIIDFPEYSGKLDKAKKASGLNEGVVCGTAEIEGNPCAIFVMDSNFMMGSMGSVVGEKITRLFEKAKDRMITFSGLKVAVLGLTFKAGTDDLREAPSSENIKLLLEQGADIYAYDPAGVPRAKMEFPEGKNGRGSITYVDSPKEALEGANICFVFTEWPQIKSVTPAQYKELMRTPLVYDGRNLYTLEEMKDAGIEYYSIGR